MNTLGDNPYLQEPHTEWSDFEAMFLFKISLARLAHLVTPPFVPLLAAPDTGILCLGVQRITNSEFCGGEKLAKIYLGHLVEPNYDLGMPTPRLSFCGAGIHTTSPKFNAAIRAYSGSNIYPGTGLEMTFDYDLLAITAKDDDGPLFDLQVNVPEPVYRELTNWGQSRTVRGGRPHCQAMRSDGAGYEHAGSPLVGTLHQHPFFGALDVSGLGSNCYHQLLTRPKHDSPTTLFRPTPESDETPTPATELLGGRASVEGR